MERGKIEMFRSEAGAFAPTTDSVTFAVDSPVVDWELDPVHYAKTCYGKHAPVRRRHRSLGRLARSAKTSELLISSAPQNSFLCIALSMVDQLLFTGEV